MTFAVTLGVAVRASTSLSATVPVGGLESAILPPWTAKVVVASLSGWLSRLESALLGLS
jgi:hypothetical protein